MTKKSERDGALTLADRLHYGLGSIGYNACIFWSSTFLQIYYTDTIGVPAGVLAILLMAVRFFDAVNDPIIGSVADRTRSRWGRYRPWLLFSGIGLPVSMIALFSARADWDPTFQMVWMCVWYVLVTVMSTCYDMPYSALHGAMSTSSAERVRISSVRMACSQVGTQIVSVLGIQLIILFSAAGGARTAGGYTKAVALVCLATLPLSLWPAFKSRERVTPPANQKKIPLKGQMLTLAQNPPIIIITIAMLAFGFIGYGRGSMTMYYFTYVVGDAKWMSVFGLASVAGNLLGTMVLMPLIYRAVRSKGKAAGLGFLLGGLSCLLVYVVTPGGLVFWLLMILIAAFMGVFSATLYSMLGDAVDYGEWKIGLRCDGFLSAFTSLAVKTGGAVGPAVGLFLLEQAAYVPNAVQSVHTLNTIKATISLVPGAVCLAAAALLLVGYRLSESAHETIRQELAARRDTVEYDHQA